MKTIYRKIKYFEDWRIVISIIIVVLIAGGIYGYSKICESDGSCSSESSKNN